MPNSIPRSDSLQPTPPDPSPMVTPMTALIIDDEQLAREELKYLLDSIGNIDVLAEGSNGIEAVSYTHLTLPTIYSV